MGKLPPLKSIEAFVAVGRSLSMQRAAVALRHTPSAISYRIRDLEQFLGVRLFERLNRGLRLTPEGETYLRVVSAAFQRIEETSSQFRSGSDGTELTVFVVQPLAAKWIIPKLSTLYTAHPDIRLSFQPRTSREYPVTFPEDLVNSVQIRFGHGDWNGFHCDLITRCRSFPFCSPQLLAKLRSPEDLVSHVWINSTSDPQAWTDWLGTARLPHLRPRQLMHVDAEAYYLVCHPDARRNPQIAAFSDWLQALGREHIRMPPWPSVPADVALHPRGEAAS